MDRKLMFNFFSSFKIVEEAAPAENEIGEVTIEDITEEQEEQNEALEESEAFDAVEPVTESQVFVLY